MTNKAKPAWNAMKAWMWAASVEEQQELADLVDSSRRTFYQIACGNRNVSEVKARLIEKAAAQLKKKNPRLPTLLRTDLNKTCRECEFARKCLGADVVNAGDFDVIRGVIEGT